MKRRITIIGCLILTLGALLPAKAQDPSPTPPVEETVRIPTEEVHITVHAQGPYAGFTPKLRSEDLTIYEDGIPQAITSMRSMPARVMVLFDSGAALTFAKSRAVTTLTAQLVVNNLPEGTSCSVVQYSEQPQTIVPWTEDRERAVTDLTKAVRTGRRSLLKNALDHALKSFATQPIENRHLILITDGLDGWLALDPNAAEVKALTAANIVVHVLSYTAIEQAGAIEAAKIVHVNLDPRPSRPRVPKEIFDRMVDSLYLSGGVQAVATHREFLKNMNEAQQLIIIDLDVERRRMLRARRGEWEKGEDRLRELTVQTGGNIRAPADIPGVFTDAIELARSIGSHYDITYIPERTIEGTATDAPRSVSVKSRSDVLKLRTRSVLTVKK